MAASWRSRQHPPLCLIICAAAVLILVLFSQAVRHRTQEARYRRDVLVSTEIPAEYIDPAAIDLTPLVNTLINSSQVGSRQLFSLLSVTSHSSLALHKLTLLVYNISSFRRIESNMFRRRYCYCVTNETNDLTDFTAILLDVMGNSTSYLQELFKSSSILSVSQRNNSDCIYICVMAGQMQKDLPQLWEVDSITPLFNQTIIEGPHRGPTAHECESDLAIWDERHANQQSPIDCTCFIYNCGWNSYNNTIDHRFPASSNNSTIYNLQTVDVTTHQPITVGPISTAALRTTVTVRSTTTTQPTTITPTTITSQPTTSTSQHTTSTSQHTTRTSQHTTSTSQHTTRASQHTTRTSQHTTRTSRHTTSSSQHTTSTSQHTTSTSQKATATAQPTTTAVHPTTLSPIHPTVQPAAAGWTAGPLSTRTTTTTATQTVVTEKPGCPWRKPEVSDGSITSSSSSSSTTVSAHKLQPCVLELCKFFSQCLCRPYSYKTRMKRYCDDSHLWYEKHTSEVCRRVRRVSFSRNLKQRCLARMCNKL
ncbi:HERV-H LTR-associating protein 1 [Centroberyx gerrardi]